MIIKRCATYYKPTKISSTFRLVDVMVSSKGQAAESNYPVIPILYISNQFM